jgi:hypothetical protein
MNRVCVRAAQLLACAVFGYAALAFLADYSAASYIAPPSAAGAPTALDATQVYYRDDFCWGDGNIAPPSFVGENIWTGQLNGAGGTISVPAAANFDNNHPCIVQLSSTGAANNAYIALSRNNIGAMIRATAVVFDSKYIFKLGQTTATQFEAGLMVQVGTFQTAAGHYVTLAYDTTAADTNFMYTHNNGGGATRTSSGVAADTNWHSFRMRSTVAGTYLLSLDGGAETSFSTNVPAATDWMAPQFMSQATSAAVVLVFVDYFGMTYAGLTR